MIKKGRIIYEWVVLNIVLFINKVLVGFDFKIRSIVLNIVMLVYSSVISDSL